MARDRLIRRLRRVDRDYEWLARAFPHAPHDLLVEAGGRLERRRYRRGEAIVAEGDLADRFYVVTSGEAEVVQRTGGRDVYVCTYAPGAYFGEVGLLSELPRNATVRAVSDVEVVSLDGEAFLRVVEHSAATAEELAEVLRIRSVRVAPRGDAVPLPPWTRLLQRVFKHPRAMHYNRLIALVLALNAALLAYAVLGGGWWSGDESNLAAIALAAQANLSLSIILRQQWVINLLGRVATLPPTSWPLRLRWMLAKWYHFGGLHVGTAVAGALWYALFVVSLTRDRSRGLVEASTATVVIAYVCVALFAVIIVMALPARRAAAHDSFELTHRFCGWAVLLLACVNTVLFTASTATVALLAAAVGCAAWPWLLLRRVPIAVDRPAAHAAVISLEHGVTPPVGTTRAISRRPFVGWHQFANLPGVDGSGYRMVISRAGDWTSAFIDDPPAHVWVRGIPTTEMANVRKLFTKVVFVCTGSGIAPILGHLLARTPPSRLVWVTKDPRTTYGEALFGEIMAAQPDAIIWNTDEQGRPDVLRLAYAAYLDSGAEAVVCVSNRRTTWEVVYGLERRGIPAFGPVWDS